MYHGGWVGKGRTHLLWHEPCLPVGLLHSPRRLPVCSFLTALLLALPPSHTTDGSVWLPEDPGAEAHVAL